MNSALLYVEVFWKPLDTNHHQPRAKWEDSRPDFTRFDWQFCRTDAFVNTPKSRMPRRLWVYWKDAAGVIWGRHIDWLWFPPKRYRDKVQA